MKTSTEALNSKVQERISEFHEYIEMGMKVESAKRLILNDTCLKAVITYVKNY